MIKQGVLEERPDGLIVSKGNQFRFGNNHELQRTNIVFVRKLLRDLARVGVSSADDLSGLDRETPEPLADH